MMVMVGKRTDEKKKRCSGRSARLKRKKKRKLKIIYSLMTTIALFFPIYQSINQHDKK